MTIIELTGDLPAKLAQLEQTQHEWVRDDYGIDYFAHENDGPYCNGPSCAKCGLSFCWHCYPSVPVECKP